MVLIKNGGFYMILVSYIGNSDPIRGDFDGPALHIVRHYKPQKAYFLLTKRMQNPKRMDFIKEAITDLSSRISSDIELGFIFLAEENPANFKDFGLTQILNDIVDNHPDATFIANISSGTPQMIAAMCLELSTYNRGFKTIQVFNPDPNSRKIESLVEFEYDFDQNLDNLPETPNRCYETDIYSFKRAQQKQLLISNIATYDYEDAYRLMMQSGKLMRKEVKQGIQLAYDCEKLRKINPNQFEKIGFYRAKATPVVNAIIEYYLSWELTFKRNDVINTMLKLTPLLFELTKYVLLKELKSTYPQYKLWQAIEEKNVLIKSYVDDIDPTLSNKLRLFYEKPVYASTSNLLQIMEHFQVATCVDELELLRDFEESSRNKIAHRIDISNINMSQLKTEASTAIITVRKIFDQLFSSYKSNIELDFFTKLNAIIVEEIQNID